MSALDAKIDDLYRAPLNDFTAARNALAKSLSGEEAKRVRGLAKPTLVPWAVNQVYWKARATYDRLMTLVQAWNTRGDKGYNLSRANCVHFAGEAAAIVGLKVTFPQNLMKKPKAFLDMILANNATLFASRAGK